MPHLAGNQRSSSGLEWQRYVRRHAPMCACAAHPGAAAACLHAIPFPAPAAHSPLHFFPPPSLPPQQIQDGGRSPPPPPPSPEALSPSLAPAPAPESTIGTTTPGGVIVGPADGGLVAGAPEGQPGTGAAPAPGPAAGPGGLSPAEPLLPPLLPPETGGLITGAPQLAPQAAPQRSPPPPRRPGTLPAGAEGPDFTVTGAPAPEGAAAGSPPPPPPEAVVAVPPAEGSTLTPAEVGALPPAEGTAVPPAEGSAVPPPPEAEVPGVLPGLSPSPSPLPAGEGPAPAPAPEAGDEGLPGGIEDITDFPPEEPLVPQQPPPSVPTQPLPPPPAAAQPGGGAPPTGPLNTRPTIGRRLASLAAAVVGLVRPGRRLQQDLLTGGAIVADPLLAGAGAGNLISGACACCAAGAVWGWGAAHRALLHPASRAVARAHPASARPPLERCWAAHNRSFTRLPSCPWPAACPLLPNSYSSLPPACCRRAGGPLPGGRALPGGPRRAAGLPAGERGCEPVTGSLIWLLGAPAAVCHSLLCVAHSMPMPPSQPAAATAHAQAPCRAAAACRGAAGTLAGPLAAADPPLTLLPSPSMPHHCQDPTMLSLGIGADKMTVVGAELPAPQITDNCEQPLARPAAPAGGWLGAWGLLPLGALWGPRLARPSGLPSSASLPSPASLSRPPARLHLAQPPLPCLTQPTCHPHRPHAHAATLPPLTDVLAPPTGINADLVYDDFFVRWVIF